MRGLYFDLVEALTEQKQDRGWAKRHAGPGKGKRLETISEGATFSWAWWTLNESAQHVTDWRKPLPPDIKNWSLTDPDSVIVFGSGAHNMRFGAIGEYEQELRTLVTRIKERRHGTRCARAPSHI